MIRPLLYLQGMEWGTLGRALGVCILNERKQILPCSFVISLNMEVLFKKYFTI